jgi:hypothetical protein
MYNFNPIELGFEPLENYPELYFQFPKTSNLYFVKIVCYTNINGLVYWYMVVKISNLANDQRITIYSGSYDFRRVTENQDYAKIKYFGIISTKKFAILLLKSLLSTCENKSFNTIGEQRIKERLGEKMRREFFSNYF